MSIGKHQKKKNYKLHKIVFIFVIFILIFFIIFTIKTVFCEETSYSSEDDTVVNNESISEVSTNLETSSSNEIEFSEDLEIKNLIDSYLIDYNLNEENFAFFYYNLDTKTEYFYNEMTQFTAASTVKLPIAMLYYDKINSGELSSSDTLLYKSSCYEAGAGLTASYYSSGDYVPINFLLHQSIVNSDNTAVNILMSNLGNVNCRKQINQKYTEEIVDDSFFNSNLTYAKYSFQILKYLYSNIENYSDLIEDLKISSEGLYLKKYITDYDVAHKYGSYNGYVHDYGIVFSKNTYLIGVFTKNVTDSDELIANISLDVLNLQ